MGSGGMSCALKSVRLIMVLFNVVFFLIGAILLAIGIYVMADPSFQKIKEFLTLDSSPGIERSFSYLEVLAIVLIILGSILLIIGFLGCCGAMKQIKLFLSCYGIVITLIIAIEVAFTIYFVVFQAKFKDQIVPKLKYSLQSTYEGPLVLENKNQSKPSPLSLAWDFMMYNFQCCGVEGAGDFDTATAWNRTNPFVENRHLNFKYPLTCCPMNSWKQNWNELPMIQFRSAVDCATTGRNVYESGCYTKLVKLIDSARIWFIVVGAIILVIELSALIVTLILCCRQRKETAYYSS